jgi:hypothetical protein
MVANMLVALRLYVNRLLSRAPAPTPMSAFAGTAAAGAMDAMHGATAVATPLRRLRMRQSRIALGKDVTLLATLRRTPVERLDETVSRLKAEASYADVRKAFIDLIALAPLEDLGSLKHVYLEHLADDADGRG